MTKTFLSNMNILFSVVCYITDYYSKDESGTTEDLKSALKEAKQKQMSVREMMHYLKKAYMSKRQIGLSEAIYRMSPDLLLTNSNISTTFVASGFPQNMSTFLRKVHDDDNENIDNEDEDLIKIEDRAGLYKKGLSIHDKYKARPKFSQDQEWNITLAQFATCYVPCQKKPENIIWIGDMSEELGRIQNMYDNMLLPKYVRLSTKNQIILRLRNYPSVMKMHASHKKDGWEQFYAEMQLFYPWRNEETDLFLGDEAECLQKFNQVREDIFKMKNKMFPYAHIHEDINSIWDEGLCRPTHISDALDPEGEQENLDDEAKGCEDIPRPETDFDTTEDDNQHARNEKEESKFQSVALKSQEDLLQLARSLVPEQLLVLKQVVKFLKKISTAKRMDSKSQLRLIVHGGAGVGKSHIIHVCSSWAEKLLRQSDSLPSRPRILLLGPTGVSANLIDGQTIHSAFDFKFGTEYTKLSDKKLDFFRDNLSELKLIIIDEISMVSADLIHNVHKRLCDIFGGVKLFAGIGYMFVGDLLQLKPVKGRFVFEQPYNPEHYQLFNSEEPIWNSCEAINLVHNHRQGAGSEWAELLNRMRVAQHTDEDVEVLRSRVIPDPYIPELESACHIHYTKLEVKDNNVKRLTSLQTTQYMVPSRCRGPPGYKFIVKQDGCIDDTPFLNNLFIKKGARIMLTLNVNTTDGLVNGSFGTIIDVVLLNGQVNYLIVKFDNPKYGAKQRASHPIQAGPYKSVNGTPIFKHNLRYRPPKIGGKKHFAEVSVLQFPLKLSWANTGHKIQGQSFKAGSKIVIHWHKCLPRAMAYVMCSRCQLLEDIYIAGNFDPKKIKCIPIALDEANRLEKISLSWKVKDVSYLSIISLNVSSLSAHFEDLKNDYDIMGKDLICLQETHVHPGQEKNFNIEGYDSVFASYGKGKGQASYSKLGLSEPITCVDPDGTYQITKMLVKDVTVISMYLSQNAKLDEVSEFVRFHATEKCIVTGDFNFTPDKSNLLSQQLKTLNFSQLIQEPTHKEGNIIDHIHVSPILKDCTASHLEYVYFSDHQGVCVNIIRND